MSLAEEPGYEELLWRVVDRAAHFTESAKDGWALCAEPVFRGAAARALFDLKLALTPAETQHVIDVCADDVYRHGPLTPLMADPYITDIIINGADEIFVDRGDGLRPAGVSFRSDQHLKAYAMRHLARAGKTVNRASPVGEADLDDGSRLHVVAPPIAGAAMKLSIRRFRTAMALDGLVASGGLAARDADVLRQAVADRKNLLIAGGPGAGKTTLMGALLGEVAPTQRIVGVEDVPELRPAHPQYVRLLTRRASGPYIVESAVRDLVREALRMRPDRLVVGEVRGPEALDMISAMTTGMDGSMTTIHASSVPGAMQRLSVLLEMAAGSDKAPQMAREAIDLVVFVRRLPDGRRAIEAIDDVG